MSVLISGMEMPIKKNGAVLIIYPDGRCAFEDGSEYKAVPVPPHGRLIDADALTGQMELNLWAIEDKAEKDLGFDETLRRGMQHGHAVCLNAVNDAPTIIEAEEG